MTKPQEVAGAPEAACYHTSMGRRITIGTSGYSYRDWVGPVYPPGTPPERFLELYSRRFQFVELNFSYYRMPEEGTLRSMFERTPQEFRFAIKAHRSITHTGGAPAADALAAYHAAVAPAAAAGRVVAVLAQFPHSFRYTTANRRALASLCDRWEDLPLYLEFRNQDWWRASVHTELRRRAVGWVVPDLPRLRGLPPLQPVVTARGAYLRLHGRNEAMWWDGDSRSRYDYSYTDHELRELVATAEQLAAKSEELFVAFNNHADGQAARNAERFAAMMAEARSPRERHR